jgi:hypothetical protein
VVCSLAFCAGDASARRLPGGQVKKITSNTRESSLSKPTSCA